MADITLTDDADVRYSFENIRTQGWLNGHASGLSVAVEWIKERAVVLLLLERYLCEAEQASRPRRKRRIRDQPSQAR